MATFDKYFLMKTADVIEYAKTNLVYFDANADLDCKEIGDGNLNYIFRVWDKNSGKSVVIKQAALPLVYQMRSFSPPTETASNLRSSFLSTN